MFTQTRNETVAQLQAQIAQLQEELAMAHSYIELLETENTQLKAEVEELSINPNFGVNTRVAGLTKAKEAIAKERRKNPSGQQVLVTVDIGGMGNSNSTRGEVATNEAMTALLEDIRSQFRAGDVRLLVDGQLNSGDEFLFWLNADISDIPGITSRLDILSKRHGFEGAYAGAVQIPVDMELTKDNLVDLANEGMEQVYPEKKVRKAEKAQKTAKSLEALGSLGFLI